MQKVLRMSTRNSTLRSEAVGWSAEDGDEAAPYARTDRPVGLMGYYRDWYCYPTPYHALGDGWKLLAPPVSYQENELDNLVTYYEWWFVKD